MKRTLSWLAAAAALAAAPSAFAQFYAGAGIGWSRIDIDCTGALTCDKTDTGGKLYGGWNVAGPWSIELAYFDWGKATGTFSDGETTSAFKVRPTGVGLSGAYNIPLGWGSCSLRLGIAANHTKTTEGAVSDSFNYTAPLLGAGCGYSFAPTWWVTFDGDFSRVKYTSSDKANTQLWTIGIRKSF